MFYCMFYCSCANKDNGLKTDCGCMITMTLNDIEDYLSYFNPLTPFSAMATAIKHHVPDRVKPSFVIFDIRALWRSAMSKITNEQTVLEATH